MVKKQPTPPRPIAPGDIVATFSSSLGEWTAAQITGLDARNEKAGVLELDWSGPEPESITDLGAISPLRLTHHNWNGKLSYSNLPWVLPRSYRRIGALPLLHDQPSNVYSPAWRLGEQLAQQRRWDNGIHEEVAKPWLVECTGPEFDLMPDRPRPEIRSLRVLDIRSLDCARLVRRFPGLTMLTLHCGFGMLSAAGSLNELTSLRSIHIGGLFGMDEQDVLLPARVPELESLVLASIPAGYAAAMRRAWRPEIPNGTFVDISRPRKPEWVAEHADNPLRSWDGWDHISSARFRQAVAQYKATRRAVLAALADGSGVDRAARLTEIGREYGQAFNKLNSRSPFIETIERDELFDALDHIVDQAGSELSWAREPLTSGVEAVRDW